MTDFDLSQADDVQKFLSGGPFDSQQVSQVVGGGGNYTFRLKLTSPHAGHRTAILKHGKPYIPGMRDVAFDVERQHFEVEAMKATRKMLPPHSLITAPEIYLYDKTANIIIMEDAASGPDTFTLTLKDYLLRTDSSHPSPPTESIMRTVGSALGQFLSVLHKWGMDPEQRSVLDFFEGNKQARTLSAWVTYGRLRSTLSGSDTARLSALTDPPFEISADALRDVDAVAQEMQALIKTSRETLVHGDFWPGNVLVRFRENAEGEDEVEQMYIVDWELVKPGSRGVEVGQFLGEVHQAQRFCEPNASFADVLRTSFLSAYRDGIGGEANLDGTAKAAMIHIGAHLITWTPRVWTQGGKERIREVVGEGVDFVLNGSKREAVVKSPLGVLLV
ncbi:hypothetical protein BDW22DRAFT_1384541 [Trametopsis cervina]|nr:hypothetical protein BDW22DRAFT_1384541 [Trametopsis cervina]